MDIVRASEKLMHMSDDTWRRHANPLSVWSRLTCLPLIALAIWSRDWIGVGAVPLLGLALAWTWWNPRAFPVPLDYGTWAARVTLGERIFLNRTRFDIPAHHLRAASILCILPILGVIPLIYGLWTLTFWAVLAGLFGTILPKLWFCDRMVWMHADMTHTTPGTRLPDPRMPQERTQP